MIMQDLKIKIKEVRDWKEPMTLEIRAYLCLAQTHHPVYKAQAKTKLSQIAPNWTLSDGTDIYCHTETIRDATAEEECAWWVLCTERPKTRSGICNATDILKDKKVILEVIEK